MGFAHQNVEFVIAGGSTSKIILFAKIDHVLVDRSVFQEHRSLGSPVLVALIDRPGPSIHLLTHRLGPRVMRFDECFDFLEVDAETIVQRHVAAEPHSLGHVHDKPAHAHRLHPGGQFAHYLFLLGGRTACAHRGGEQRAAGISQQPAHWLALARLAIFCSAYSTNRRAVSS